MKPALFKGQRKVTSRPFDPEPAILKSDGRAIHLALRLLLAALLSALPLPWGNDLYYLLRLETFWNPALYGNDWVLSSPSPEHFVFNALFGVVPLALPIEVNGWLGRILCWSASIVAISRLGIHFRIPRWMITASVMFWLLSGQSLVGGEWVIQGFEAKCIAYVLLFIAIDQFLRQRLYVAAVMLGLTLSFHPGVGLWAGVAVAVGLLAARLATARQLVVVALVTFACALPGLIPILLNEPKIYAGSANDWEYIARVLMPTHLDPFSWTRRDILGLYVVYLFNILHALRNRKEAWYRFLLGFEGALCIVFTLGLIWRAFEQYELLRLMPFRHFPVFALLFFFFHLSRAYDDARRMPRNPIHAIVGALALISLPNTFGITFDRLSLIRQAWTAPPSDFAPCLTWIRDYGARDAIVIAPPWIREAWWDMKRAQVINYYYLPYHRVPEWRERMEAVGGDLWSSSRTQAESLALIKSYYRAISSTQMEAIAAKYGATLLVTESTYPFRLAFEFGSYRVYHLPQVAPRSTH